MSNGNWKFAFGAFIGAAVVLAAIMYLEANTANLGTTHADKREPSKDINPVPQVNSPDANNYRHPANVITALSLSYPTPEYAPSMISSLAALVPQVVPHQSPLVAGQFGNTAPALDTALPAPTKAPALTVLKPVPALVPAAKPIQGVTDFTHTPDFRTVYKDGKRFELATNESRIIEYYHRSYENGVPELHQSAVLVELEIETQRIKDVFKRNKPAFQALFCIGERKGSYRLNIG